ncbi:MAG: hypothetical protein AAB921_00760 [Patescibacteria group bacterium]
MNSILRTAPLLIILAGLLFGYLGMRCGINSSCPVAALLSDFAFSLFKPLWIFSLFSLPIGVALLFAKQKVFKTWLHFAFWWLPLSVIVIYILSSGGRGMMPLYSYSQGGVAIVMGSLFTIISLGVIGWKQFGSKK